jgi:hypothetical protein
MSKAKALDDRLEIRLPQEQVNAACRKAQRAKRPLSDVLRELLRAWVVTTK